MKTYIFDFDGTIVDSMPTWSRVMKRLLDETNTPYGEDIIKIITPLGNLGTAKYYRSIGCPLTDEEFLERKDAYLTSEYRDNIPAKESAKETLIKMKERGDSLNVLTASAHSNLDPCLKRLGLFDLFDNVWSCDDFNTTKTDPNIYRLAADRLGKTVGEVIFVDDNLEADKTAKAAGMTGYGIYDESSKDYIEAIKAIADGYAYLFSDLLTL